jgi:hypothetical protein
MGYVVYWQLAELGLPCELVAPTLVSVKSGDRVETERLPLRGRLFKAHCHIVLKMS